MFFGRAISSTSKSGSFFWTKIDNVYFRSVVWNRYARYHRSLAECTNKSLFSSVALSRKMASTSSHQQQTGSSRNRLGKERSPYLLQHASNPVDWYPWGEEAFMKARAEDKLIFLSVGYSTCHWCHVMERESFEDESTASIMNEYFVNVKVDREERPDVDRTYMTFVQVSSGSGGWPMSVFITPDLKPVAGGTYFPPNDSFGRPSFKSVLLNIAKRWMDQRSKVISTSVRITELLRETAAFDVGVAGALLSGETPGKEVWELCLKQLQQGYQQRWGGFSPAPKFPQPTNLNFLFNVAATEKQSAELAKKMSLHTLDKMALGGLNDHISLGFARYSTDEKWHVPHFEKMLYDQAQLAVAYTNAYLVSKEEKYANIVRDILTYVTRDLSHPEGGFFSAEDADSYPTFDSDHKKEGAFCVWSYEQVCSLLNESLSSHPKLKLSDIFCHYYNVRSGGNVNPDQDPHNELDKQNVLIIFGSEEETCEKFGISHEEFKEVISKSKKILYEARQKRPRPHLDDKIVTAWNGLMISGFAKAGFALKDNSFKERAVKAAEFIKSHLYTKNKRLLRSCYTQENAVVQIDKPIEGFLDDYAFLIHGLLELYECTLNQSWLEWALELQHTQDSLFWDHGLAGYFATSSSDNSLLFRLKDDQDGAEPCGNSISAGNLLRLGAIIDDHDMLSKASNIFSSFSNRLSRFPLALPQMVSELMVYHHSPTLVVITGDVRNADTIALLDVIAQRFIPGLVLMVTDSDPNSFICSKNHSVAKMKKLGERQAAYVCRGHTCSLPVTTPSDLAALLS